MPLAGSMLTNIRKIFGDTSSNFIDDTSGLTWLDMAQQDFSADIWQLEEIKGYYVVAKSSRFLLPTSCILPMSVMWFQSQTRKLEPEPPNVWDNLMENYPQSDGTPYNYTIFRRAQDQQEMRVGPQRPSTASGSTAMGAAATIAAATLTVVTSTGIFRSRGWALIGSGTTQELVEYGGVDGLTLTNVARGMGDTAASAVASNTDIRQVDILVRFKKIPVALATNTSPEIPEPFHRYLESYALYLAWLAHGEDKRAEGQLQVYLKQKEIARKAAGRRQQDGLQRIRPRRMGGLYPPV